MTDPAPSPDATPRPVPVRPMPRLGGGLHWPDILAKIEADRQRQPEPAVDPLGDARRRLDVEPAKPSTVFDLGTPEGKQAFSAAFHAGVEEAMARIEGGSSEGGEGGDAPADLRDALHAEIRSVLGDPPTCDHGTANGTYCWPCAQQDRGAELRAYAAPVEAPPAAELYTVNPDAGLPHGPDGLDVLRVATMDEVRAEAAQIYADLREQIGTTPYLAPALEAAASPSRRARWLRALDRARRWGR